MKKLLALIDIKLLKFILVGVINTAVDYGLFLILRGICPENPLWLRWLLLTAIPCALASVVSYFLNKYFTFKNTEKGWAPVLRFAVNIAACYLLAYGMAIPLMEWALSAAAPALRDNLTKVAGMCLFTGFNYLGQRLFAFRNKTGESR